MAGTFFRWRLQGVDEVLAAFREAGKRAAKPDKLLEQIGKYLLRAIDQRIERGIPPPIIGGKKFLQRKDSELRRSLTVRGHPDNIFEIKSNRVLVGSRDFRAGVHDRGLLIFPRRKKYLKFFIPALGHWVQVKSVRLPKRPITEYSDADRVAIRRITEDWIDRQIVRLFQ